MNEADVLRALQLRAVARATKDWVTADALKEKLVSAGIRLEDAADGTTLVVGGLAPVTVVEPSRQEFWRTNYEMLDKREAWYSRRIADLVKENLALKYGKKSPA